MRPSPPWAVVEVFLHDDERQWSNVFWYSVSGSFPAPYDVNADTDAFRAHFQAPYTGVMCDSSNYDGVKLTINIAGVVYSGAAVNGSAGGLAGTPLPTEVCAVARVQSTHGGRTGRGRHYFSGMSDVQTNESRLDAPTAAPFSTLAAAIAAAVTLPSGINATPKLWSKKDNALYAINSVVFDSVLGHRTKLRPRF